MDNVEQGQNYGGKALLPIVVLHSLYVGCGVVFSGGWEGKPFWMGARDG